MASRESPLSSKVKALVIRHHCAPRSADLSLPSDRLQGELEQMLAHCILLTSQRANQRMVRGQIHRRAMTQGGTVPLSSGIQPTEERRDSNMQVTDTRFIHCPRNCRGTYCSL